MLRLMTVGIFFGHHDNLQQTGSTLDLPYMLPAKVETRNTAHVYMIHMVHVHGTGTCMYKLHNPRTSSQTPSSYIHMQS